MPWTRGTSWRQGSVVSTDNLRQLGVIGDKDEAIGVVVSHDCDIVNDDLDSEPNVEFILGCAVDEPNGHYAYAKNPRTLHILIEHQGGGCTCELQATAKNTIKKEVLHKFEPSPETNLDRKTLVILQNWLAARYRRQTLPNSLVDRLRPVFDFLQRQGKKKAHSLLGYWLDYMPFNEELPPDQNYELWIYIVYSVDEAEAQEHAEEIANNLRDKFLALIDKNKEAGNIDLRHCEAFSETEFTLSDLRGTIEYGLDHISLKLDPPGPTASG